MGRISGQQAFLISILLLMVFLAMGCGNADSRDTTSQADTMPAQAGEEHLQRVTLRITGMS